MNPAQHLEGPGAERPGTGIHRRTDSLERGIEALLGYREKPHAIGIDQCKRGAADQKPCCAGAQCLIDRTDHRKQSHAKHHARQGIPGARDARQQTNPATRMQANRIGHRERHRNDDQYRRQRQERRIEGPLHKARIDLTRADPPLTGEQQRRQGKPEQTRQRTGRTSRPARKPRQWPDTRRPTRARVKEHPTTLPSFRPDQQQDDRHQQQGQSRRTGAIAEALPRPIDACREGIDREKRDRAEVGQRLHRHQREPGRHRGPRHRPADTPPDFWCRQAQRPRRIGQRLASLGKGISRQHVDIGIKRKRQEERRSRKRSDLRKPVVADLPAHDRTQPGLQAATGIEKVGIGIGHHECRHGQRQNQPHLEKATPGKLEGCNQPSGTHPEQQNERADQYNQHD